jgi:hypothetical protein
MISAAGATADVDCSLCEAGTYGTGSGQNPLTRNQYLSQYAVLIFFSFSLLFCEQHLSIRPDSPDLRLTIFAAGATAGISCSLCEAGTYWTGSGQDPLTEKSKELAIDVLLIFLSYIC